MAATIDARITVGDTRAALVWTLRDAEGAPLTLTAVAIRMVSEAGVVKINWAAATSINTPSAGIARYQFAAGDVDTAGIYYVQMRDTVGAVIQHWPVGKQFTLEIVPVIV